MNELFIATTEEGSIRIIAMNSTDLVSEGAKIHKTSPTCSAAFGRVLTATALMGSMLKGEKEQISIKMDGGGPIKGIIGVSDSYGNVKGYMGNNSIELPLKENGKLDVGGAIGKNGSVTIVKTTGLKAPYTGNTDIVSGEVGEDLAYYFTISEQTPSAVALGVLVDVDSSIKVAGGFIIQMLPNHDPMVADLLTYRLEEMVPITISLSEGKSIKEIIEDIFYGINIKYLETREINYKCNCSRKKVEKALMTIGKDSLKEMVEEKKDEEVVCEFCQTKYIFNNNDINEIINNS